MKKKFSLHSIKYLILPLLVGLLPILVSVQVNRVSHDNKIESIQNSLEKSAEQITGQIRQKITDILFLTQELNNINFSHSDLNEWNRQVSELHLTTRIPEVKYLGVIRYNKELNTISDLHGYQNALSSPDSYDEIFSRNIKNSSIKENVIQEHLSILDGIYQTPVIMKLSDNPDKLMFYFPVEKVYKDSHPSSTSRDFVFIYGDSSEFFLKTTQKTPDINFSIIRSTSHLGMRMLNYSNTPRNHAPIFRYKTELPVLGEYWVISFYSLPELENLLKDKTSFLIYGVGILLSLTLFMIFYMASFSKMRAIKLAEKMTLSLKKTEEDFRNAFNSTSTGIVLIGEDMILGRSNKHFQRITGYSEEEIMGMHFENIMEYTDEDKEAQKKVKKNEQSTFANTRTLKRKNGESIWIAFNAAVIRRPNSKKISYVINIEDITEKLKIQREMETSEKCLKVALDASKSGVWRWDPVRDIAHWDSAIYEIFGIKEKEVKSKSLSILLPMIIPEDRERVAKSFASSINARKQLICDYRIFKQDEKDVIKYIRVVGYPIKNKRNSEIEYAGIAIDRTKELETQQSIAENEERLSMAMESFNICVWDFDPATNITKWNKHAMDMYGIPNDGQNRVFQSEEIFQYIHPDDRERIGNGMLNAVKNKCSYEDSFRITRVDKSTRTLRSKMSPIPGRKETKFIGVTTDITEENKLEQLKANFVSVASHQLRTPLTAIRWFREMISDNTDKEPLTEKQERNLLKIEESSVRMLELVDDLLQVSKLDNRSMELKPTEYDILDATEKIIDQVKVKAKEKKQKINISCNLKNRSVMADQTMTEQVIQNLTTNAVKYSPEKSTINIKIVGDKKNIKWSITDQGIGIGEEDRSKVFQQFFRSKKASESKADGSGLGLYISKSIIELSGGTIDYTSIEGKGSTFSFTLPKA